MQGGANSQTRSSVNSTASGAGAKAPPQTHSRTHQLSKRTVPVVPTFIPTPALTPRTKVLLDRSGPEREKWGLVSPATKPAGDRPQRASSKKWWWPPSSNGTSEGKQKGFWHLGEIQPDVICHQETKLDHSPHPKTYQCANYDCYNKSLRRRPRQLPCGGVSIYIYIKKSLPQAHPVGYSPSGCSGAGHTGKYTCQYPFCLHTKPWTPYNPRSLTYN